MLNTIEKAAENFCIHQLGTQCCKKDGVSQKQTFIAYIDINTQEDQNYRVYLASEKEFLQKVAQLFLEEDESDDETLQDMMLETVNLIVGSAKVIAQENEHTFTIQTPHFEKIDTFSYPYNEASSIALDDALLSIAIKELDE